MSLRDSARARSIGAEELADRLRDRDRPQVWNVLTDEFFDGRLIPGSRRVPLDFVVRGARSAALATDAEIVVYCSGVDCPQGGLAAAKLTAAGYSEVAVFDGGLQAWAAAGHPFDAVEGCPASVC